MDDGEGYKIVYHSIPLNLIRWISHVFLKHFFCFENSHN